MKTLMLSQVRRFLAIFTACAMLLGPSNALGFNWTDAFKSNVFSSQYYSTDDSCVVDVLGGGYSDSTGTNHPKYIALGNIPITGKQVGTTTYGGGYGSPYGNNAWGPSNPLQGGPKPYDDNGMGFDDKPLPGRTAYAELGMGSKMGNLPMYTKLEITYKGKSIIAEKDDIGVGDGPINGVDRELDLWWETARLLNLTEGSDVTTIHVVDPSTPLTPINGQATTPASTGNACCNTSSAANSTDPNLPGADNVEKVFRYFIGKGLTAAQAAGIIGNFMQESGTGINPGANNTGARSPDRNPSDIIPGVTWKGGGIAQWEDPGRWTGSSGLLSFIAGKGTFSGHPQGDGKNWKVLAYQLDFTWWEMNNNRKKTLTDLKQDTTPSQAAYDFEKDFEGASEPNNAARDKYANDTYKLAISKGWANGGATVPVGNSTAADCPQTTSSGGGVEAIAAMAMSDIAWPNSECYQTAFNPKQTRNGCHDSTAKYAAVGGTHTAPGADDAFTDCGIFVATVMHVSKVDPSYPRVQTGVQRQYILDHPKLYYHASPKSTNDLRPGDILVYDGHTMIYIGPQNDKNNPKVDASWYAHTPQRGGMGGLLEIMRQPGFIIGRYIGSSNNGTITL